MARVADEVVKIPGHRIPPQDLDAERSVLGAMLLSTEAMAEVVELLDAEDFYRSAHGKIYQALRMLFAHGEPIDVITAVDALRRAGILDEVGGALYLRDLIDEVPTPAGAPHYAKIVADAALRRRLIGAAADIIDTAYEGATDADGIADGAEQRIYDVARREDTEDAAIVGDLINRAMSELESIQNRESAYTGLPTGFRDLDDLTSGLQPGNLVIIAARPGIGKSSLAMNIARNVAVTNEPVAVFSLEMIALRDRHAPAVRRGAGAVGPDPQQARRSRRLDPRGAGGGDAARGAAAHRRLRQRQHRRHPREGPPDEDRPPGAVDDHRRLPPADDLAEHAPPRQPPAGGRRDLPVAQAPREGALDPGRRACRS